MVSKFQQGYQIKKFPKKQFPKKQIIINLKEMNLNRITSMITFFGIAVTARLHVNCNFRNSCFSDEVIIASAWGRGTTAQSVAVLAKNVFVFAFIIK